MSAPNNGAHDQGAQDQQSAGSTGLTASPSASVLTSPPVSNELRYQQFPEDLRAPWGWMDLLLFVLVTFGLYFGAAIALLAGLLLTGHSPQALKNSPAMVSQLALVITLGVSAAQLGYLYLRIRIASAQPFWRAIGWRAFSSVGLRPAVLSAGCVVGGVVFATLIALASAGLGQKRGLPVEAFFQDRRSALMLMLLGVLVAPLVEETIFRGFLYPVLARSLGVAGGVIVTGILFGLLHAMQLWGAWAQIGLLMVVGITFTAARAVTRTVLTSYLLHVSYNAYLFAVFLYATHGLRQLPVVGH